MRNPQIRMVHGKPTSLINRVTIMGNIMPPRLEPVNMMPNAAPRFLLNHPAAQVTAVNLISLEMLIKRIVYQDRTYMVERGKRFLDQSTLPGPERSGSIVYRDWSS